MEKNVSLVALLPFLFNERMLELKNDDVFYIRTTKYSKYSTIYHI